MTQEHDFQKTLGIKPSTRKAVCEVHGDYTPIIASHPHCEKCAESAILAYQQEIQRDEFKKHEIARFEAAGVPERYVGAGFKNYVSSSRGQNTALQAVMRYASSIRKGYRGSLIFSGSTGTGKTHLAIGILKNVMARTGSSSPMFAKYTTSSDLIEHVANAWKRDNDSERNTMYRLTYEVDLLIVDEYGLDDQDPRTKKHVDRVLRARYDAKKPTLIISNETPDILKNMLGDRVWSRLIESDESRVIKFNWMDHRGRE